MANCLILDVRMVMGGLPVDVVDESGIEVLLVAVKQRN